MSLLVNIFSRTADKITIIETTEQEELAGFEACREALWGSKTAESLGLRLLISLKEQDLYVEFEELGHLKKKLKLYLKILIDLRKRLNTKKNLFSIEQRIY